MNNKPSKDRTRPSTASTKRPSAQASNSHIFNSQRIARLVIVAVVSFSFAIALPFLAPRALFPESMVISEDTAPVVVDGRVLFQVTDTIATASARDRARTISEGLQKFAQAQWLPEIRVAVLGSDGQISENIEAIADTAGEETDASEDADADEAPSTGGLATVWLAYPSIDAPKDESAQFNFTVTAGDTTDSLSPVAQANEWSEKLRDVFEEAKEQRQESYIRSNLWQIPVVPVVAAIAHWLAGLIWRNYLANFMRTAAMEGDLPTSKGREQFTTINLFLNATLLLLRFGIWIGALLYASNLFPDTRKVSYRTLSQLNEYFIQDTIPLGNNPVSILDIFRVLILVLLVSVIARILSNVLKRKILQETGINRGVQEAIAILIRYSLLLIGCVVVLQASGIDLSSLTLLASALGVGAGLGLQNIVKDIGSGLVLVFERPIQVGEFVQIGDQSGTVERIGARSAEIRTLDQVSIIVPNSEFLENKVVNWSHRNPISRICIPVGVSYKSDPEAVRDLLLRVAKDHTDVLKAPPALVLFKEFGDSALIFNLMIWIAQPSRQFVIKSDLLFKISKALRDENIEIPFPQRDVHIIQGALPDRVSDQTS